MALIYFYNDPTHLVINEWCNEPIPIQHVDPSLPFILLIMTIILMVSIVIISLK